MSIKEETPTDPSTSNLDIFTKFILGVFIVFLIILALVTYLSGHAASIVENSEPHTFLYKTAMVLTPFFTPLIAFNALIIIILLLKRSLWLLIPCMAIAINWHIIPSIIQIRKAPDSAELATAITLQSYNIHRFSYGTFENTAGNILFSTAKNRVDILCLQEYTSYKDELNYKESIATIDDYVRESNKVLYQNRVIDEHSNKSTFTKQFPHSCFSNPEDRTGLAIFSFYPIVHSETYDFPESQQEALLADIKVAGELIRIITVHLQTSSLSQHNREIRILKEASTVAETSYKWSALSTLTQAIEENSSKRKSQADIIYEMIKKSPHPVIVCGDLNDTPNSYSYQKFENILNDAFKTSGSGYAFSYIPLMKSLRIDYIFYSNEIEPKQFYYKSYPWSDHSTAIFHFTPPTTISAK